MLHLIYYEYFIIKNRLKCLYLNSNCITSIPNLKLFRNNHVVQEFNKSYYKRKNNSNFNIILLIFPLNLKSYTTLIIKGNHSARTTNRRTSEMRLTNETMVKDLERPNSEMNIHSSNMLRNSFILEENEEESEVAQANATSSSQPIEESTKKTIHSSTDINEKQFDLPFAELVYINLADNKVSIFILKNSVCLF